MINWKNPINQPVSQQALLTVSTNRHLDLHSLFFSPSLSLPPSASPSSALSLSPTTPVGLQGLSFLSQCKVNLKEGYCHGWILQTVLWWYKLLWFVCCASLPLISLFISIPLSFNSCSSPPWQPERLEVIKRKGKTDSHAAFPICSWNYGDMGRLNLGIEHYKLTKVWAVPLQTLSDPSLPVFFVLESYNYVFCFLLLVVGFFFPFDFSYRLIAVFISTYSHISMLSAPMLGASVCCCSSGVLNHFWDTGVGTSTRNSSRRKSWIKCPVLYCSKHGEHRWGSDLHQSVVQFISHAGTPATATSSSRWHYLCSSSTNTCWASRRQMKHTVWY